MHTEYTPQQSAQEIPFGYCHCGCGQPAPIAKTTDKKRGYIKGQPRRFISGHNNQRHPYTDEPNPSGLCQCGCGQKTKIATQTDIRRGLIKGQPVPFLRNHIRFTGLADRFWSRVTPGNPDECWEWQGSRWANGYGRMFERRKYIKAHRVSWELHNGPIPGGMLVCHKCDNPPCVNPHHLFLGTNADNMQDMAAKGRHGHTGGDGESNSQAKLTNADIVEIRKLSADGVSQRKIAKQFGVNQTGISAIVTRKRWSHVP